MEITAKIKEGKLIVVNRLLLDQYIAEEAAKGKDYLYKIQITRVSPAKSRDQENFRWGVIYPEVLKGLRDAGYWEVKTKEDVHEIVKGLFLKKEILSDKTGETLTLATSKDLSVEDEQELQENIRLWASEYLGISLSEPERK